MAFGPDGILFVADNVTCYRDEGRAIKPDDVIAALNDRSTATGRVLSQAAPEWSYTEPVELNDFNLVRAETYERN